MKKFYGVKNGYHIGVFETWDECKKEISGFSGAEYKGFATRSEAEAYVRGDTDVTPQNADCAVAYCDGSFDLGTGRYSYGLVVLRNGTEVKFSQAFPESEMSAMRNVAGEIEGAKAAMRYCADNGIPALKLYYDYIGIEKWCVGGWKTNRDGTVEYKNFYEEISKKLRVEFVKVKGHSGDKYNDEADRLAKAALGLLEVRGKEDAEI